MTQRSDSARKSRSACGNLGDAPICTASSRSVGTQHVQRANLGRLFQEADVVGTEVVESELHDRATTSHSAPAHHTRTEMRAEPGGGSSEATMT